VDAAQIAAYVDASRDADFSVLAGSAPSFYAALCLGAKGAILAAACVVPAACVALFDAFSRGELIAARDLQRRILPIALAVTSGYGVPGLKKALELTGYVGGPPRLPLLPAPPEATPAIRSALEQVEEYQ
jgi:dihydrodipicolinate synthase/N-acetylneuraminate lyase